MKTMTRRVGLQMIAGAAAAPAAATTASLPNPDAELIELGRRFVELARLRDAASEEVERRLEMARLSYPPGTYRDAILRGIEAREAYETACADADRRSGYADAEDSFDAAMDQMRATFARMITMRPTTIEGMRAIALAVFHFEWPDEVRYAEGATEGAALAVLVAGLLDKPLPDCLPDWAAAWI